MSTSRSRGRPHPKLKNKLKSSGISFKKSQNAPFSFTAFKMSSIDQTIIPNSDGMHHFLSLFSTFSQQFQNIVSNSVTIQQSPSLFSHFQGNVCLPKPPTPPSECMIQGHCFEKKISAVTNCFKYRHNAHFTILVFFLCRSKTFLNTVRKHALGTLFSSISLQFKIVSRQSFSRHSFQNNYLQFQKFSAVPNNFK